MDPNDPATALHEHLRLIPQVLAMQVQLAGERDGRLCLRAPLGPNVNDKGTAFGGSLVSLMTLAGWCLVSGRPTCAARWPGKFRYQSGCRR